MKDADLLALHRNLVSVFSESQQEKGICDTIEAYLGERGVEVQRYGDNLVATCGQGPILCFNTHLDTVPPGPGWTRPALEATAEEGKVYGLGSNDAKASVAAMIAAFMRLRSRGQDLRVRVVLTLVCEEETGGKGTEALLPILAAQGLEPEAAIIGEPTSLDVAVAQKGLLILELKARGQACHAAHRRVLGAPNAIRLLTQDLAALDSIDLGPPHVLLGEVTLEPTIISGGTARNVSPGEATCILDVRTNPRPGPEVMVSMLRASVQGDLRVLSDRLRSCEIDPRHPLVEAAREARPAARTFGSRGLSDLVFFRGIPAIKVGPGKSERSHTPDEFVYEEEILEGAGFYESVALAYQGLRADLGSEAREGALPIRETGASSAPSLVRIDG